LKGRQPLSALVKRNSKMRKVSLRKLEMEISRLRQRGTSPTSEMEFLAGLTRVEFVFVYPDQYDIVLAGPAEEWKMHEQGEMVGAQSGTPVLHLSDLLVAMRAAKQDLFDGIYCSMDATADGKRRYAEYLTRGGIQVNDRSILELKQAIGPFVFSFRGVPDDCHFSRVMTGSDIILKRLGMELELSSTKGVNSYIRMLQSGKADHVQNSMPRWWLATDYEPILRDGEGFVWQIRGAGVKALSEDNIVAADGQAQVQESDDSLTQQWADNFTEHYEELATEFPVLGQLRGCMDLAVVAALLARHRLTEISGSDFALLKDEEQLPLAKYHVPKQTDPQLSIGKKGRHWIIAASGGINLRPWMVASEIQQSDEISAMRPEIPADDGQWWWD
jgi:hypothetical protein